MNKYHQRLLDYFGEDWFVTGWKEFCEARDIFPKNSFKADIIELELALHPLYIEFFRYQKDYKSKLDFSRIPRLGSSDYILTHLGRDIGLLEQEIKDRGNKIKTDLLDPYHFEAHRFNLLIASGYKLLGYKVELVASSNKMRKPDIFVKKDDEFYIESKQRNQTISDGDRYKFFGELAEKTSETLHSLNMHDYQIGVDLTSDSKLHEIKEHVFKSIDDILHGRKHEYHKSYRLTVGRLSSNISLLTTLRDNGHFNDFAIFSRTEDGFIASDPQFENAIWLNKSINPDKIPSAVYDDLYNADSKNTDGKKLVVYLDLERGYSEWVDKLSKHVSDNLDQYNNDLPNIDGYMISKTPINYIGKTTFIQPKFSFVGKQNIWNGLLGKNEIFGLQGHTGMDDYIIKDFIQPTTSLNGKYILCPKCGFTLANISTNLPAGAQLSKAVMPCLNCGGPMDMIILI